MNIYPSLTSQNLKELTTQIRMLEPHCAGFHIDIMDGKFVRNIMGSAELTNQIAKITNKQLWVHLMVQDALAVIKELKIHSNDIVTFHFSAQYDYQQIIDTLESHNLRPSLGLNPKTPVSALSNAIHAIDHVTIMSVEPGQSGQPFLRSTLNKLERLQIFKAAHECTLTIAVDGGVNKNNIQKLAHLGVRHVAVSSAILEASDPAQALKELSSLSL